MAAAAVSASSHLPASNHEKPVIVRIKRKATQARLDTLWLEINERPQKWPLLDFARLSIAESEAKANQGQDIALLLDDNVFYQPPNSLIKDSCREPVARGTRGSEEEQINKELQAVAEGAATAVLQSSIPSMPVFVAHETKAPFPNST